MLKAGLHSAICLACIMAAFGVTTPALSQDSRPTFGGAEEVEFAEELWQALEQRGIVGEDAIQTHPYAGTSMHGPVIQYISGKVGVGDRTDTFILKRNYRGEDLSVKEIFEDPMRNFDSMGVMFRREDGYAPDSRDWFWVKYMPDGTVATTPDGAKMAGKVGPAGSSFRPVLSVAAFWNPGCICRRDKGASRIGCPPHSRSRVVHWTTTQSGWFRARPRAGPVVADVVLEEEA